MRNWHVIVAVLGALALGHALAQEKENQWTPPDWMKPTKEHEMLKKSVGEFDVKGEIWMAAGQDPMVMPATATRKMIKNGFFVQEDFKGNFMGQAFEGTLIQGYDPFRKKHTSVWFDNGSPIMQMSYGDVKDGKCVMVNESPDGMLNKMVTMKSVAEEKDGTMVISFYRVIDGKDQMHMRLTYTRKGGEEVEEEDEPEDEPEDDDDGMDEEDDD
jgi:hypothetical protein